MEHIDMTTFTLTAEIESLKEAYAALNRNDIPAMVDLFDPEMEWNEPPEYHGGGTYRGRAELKAHFLQARGSWAEGSCEPVRFIVAGDKVIVFVHVHARLKHETEWREGDLADVYTFRNGKAIHMRSFPDRQKALEWAGAKA